MLEPQPVSASGATDVSITKAPVPAIALPPVPAAAPAVAEGPMLRTAGSVLDPSEVDIARLVRRRIASMPLVRAHAAARAPAFERDTDPAPTASRAGVSLFGRLVALVMRPARVGRGPYPLPLKTRALIANLIAMR